MNESEEECLKRAREQIEKYKQLYPKYKLCAETLHKVLEKAVKKYAPSSIVQTRAKSVSSFGEKIYRKKDEFKNPVDEFTDFCGGRVIAHTNHDVERICDFIKNHFEIDWNNSVDTRTRLKPSEMGYLSLHYIASFRRGVFPTKEIDVVIPDAIFSLKSEIQVRTLLQHAWADFTHDRSYKGQFKVPPKWEHELATLAATLEETDNAFTRIEEGLRAYASSYAANMNAKDILFEIKKLQTILDYDPENLEIAYRIGMLAITLGDWEKAIKVLKKHEDSDYQPILVGLGVATCKKHKKDPQSTEYKQGLRYFERACASPNRDPDTLSSYAGALKGIDDNKAKELYYEAFKLDPSNSYPLGNYLEYQIAQDKDTRSVELVHVEVEAALKRCREQAEVGMNLPWVYYDIGKLDLFLGDPIESLSAYAKAVQRSTAVFMISTSLRSLKNLEAVREKLVGYDWMVKLLSVGQLTKTLSEEERREYLDAIKALASGNGLSSGPIVIIAGGCNVYSEAQLQGSRQMIVDAFDDFKGTLISGGTKSGICDFAGETAQKYSKSIQAIGYVPGKMPADVTVDERYSEIRRTEGDGFSPLEPLQYWIDIIAAGIDPSKVKLLGIGGGSIAAAEYKTALALGACVAIIDGSGGEAERLLADPEWAESKMLIRLPRDTMTIRAFIGRERPKLPEEIRDEIARAIQLDFKRSRTGIYLTADAAMADWDKLPENLKESNRQQADDILKKLDRVNCTVHKVTDRPIALMTFTTKEIEDMAEMEHARWNVERLLNGWKWARERDISNKRSPYIVGWTKLPEDIKEYDRIAVRRIPEYLAAVHLEIRRKTIDGARA